MPKTQLPSADIELVNSPKWIRVFFGGEMIASSRDVTLKRGWPLTYYFPEADVNMAFLQAANGKDNLWDVKVGDRVAERAAFNRADEEALDGHIAFRWHDMDAWFEEDEQVYVHPRDPYVRIDTIQSSRHVKVVVNGKTVAETRRPVLLFETGLKTRFYMPKTDVRRDLLVPSDSQTECPYKGEASYYSVRVGDRLIEDAVWHYPFPDPEAGKIQGMLCFYHEKVDQFIVDGEPFNV